jgi:hypothetical protein
MVPVARFAIRRSPANRDRDTLTAIAVLLVGGAGARYTAIFKETASRSFRKNYWTIKLDGRWSPLPLKAAWSKKVSTGMKGMNGDEMG